MFYLTDFLFVLPFLFFFVAPVCGGHGALLVRGGGRGLNTLTSRYVLKFQRYFPRIRPPPRQGGHHPVYLLRCLQRFHLSLVVGWVLLRHRGRFLSAERLSVHCALYWGSLLWGMRERVEWRTSVHKHSGMVCLLGANHTSGLLRHERQFCVG